MFKFFLTFIRRIKYCKFIVQFFAQKFNEKMTKYRYLPIHVKMKMIIFFKNVLKEVMLQKMHIFT
jgi:hypothetical protein